MKNVIIYSESGQSKLESILKKDADYSIRTKNLEEIKEAQALNPYLIVLDCPEESLKDTLARNKFPTSTLIVSDKVLEDANIRADYYDYLLTPINEDELKVRVENMLKVKELREEIQKVATTDELTGLFNRKYLHDRLEAELSRAKRYNLTLSCLLIDIDFFKVVNDMYGYDWGDILLKDIAEIVKKHVRKEDILTRYGDEEFLVILPNTNEESAFLFAERLRRDVERMEFYPEAEEERHPVTISGGISCYPHLENVDENANTLIRYAEHALYNAKKRGKNKIVQFSQINLEL